MDIDQVATEDVGMRIIWKRTTLGLTTIMLGLMTAVVATSATPAAAATAPVLAGLTITPALTTVGTAVQITGTATNTTANAVQASLGIDNNGSLHITKVLGSPGCTPRNLTRLVYCGIQTLAPNATATITLTVVPATTGAFTFRTYARITYTSDDSFAYGTLNVS